MKSAFDFKRVGIIWSQLRHNDKNILLGNDLSLFSSTQKINYCFISIALV